MRNCATCRRVSLPYDIRTIDPRMLYSFDSINNVV